MDIKSHQEPALENLRRQCKVWETIRVKGIILYSSNKQK